MNHAITDRLPPQSLDAEQAVLGAALISRNAVSTVLSDLDREDFYLDAHRRIYDAIAHLAERDEPVDVLTVPEELRRRTLLDQIGGIAYINTLAESVPTAAHANFYAQSVAEKATLRKLIDAGSEIVGMGYAQEEDADHIVDRAEQLIFAVGQRRLKQGFVHIRETVIDALGNLDKIRQSDSQLTGVPTGFSRIDTMTSGLQKGDLVIIAARPSMGKTSLAIGMGLNAATLADVPIAVFSLEMSKEQLAHRLICAEAKVDGMRLKTGYLRTNTDDDESDWTKLGRAIGRLGDLPIFITDDSSDISVLEMRAKCRRLKSEHGLGMVIVDYLQLIRAHGGTENRNQEISLITRMLKNMARELEVPVIALSQLSRNVERREDKRPMLSDLRESGSIEAEADIVMMLYRSRYYNRDNEDGGTEPPPGVEWLEEAECILAKHRNGPVGTVRLGFLRRYARFEDLAEGYDSQH